jgi:hypothetical protein
MRTLLALALLLPVAGCDALSDAADETACRASGYADVGSVRASVSGDAFSTACVAARVEAGALVIAGADNVVSDDDQEVLTLTFPSTDLASYEIGASGATATFARRTTDSNDQAEEVYVATDGTLTLAEGAEPSESSATRVRGSFSFSARNGAGDVVAVSGGTFDVTF